MDYENIFKDFLDLIYQNDILPNEMVCVLEKYSKNRDFRLICDLLYYKEKYCKTAGDPRMQQFYKELTMHARALQDINIWRDAMSLNNLSYLKAALNNDAHNDTHRSDPAIIKPMIQQLIRAANLKPDGYLINNIDKKYTQNTTNLNSDKILTLDNLKIGDEVDHHFLRDHFKINIQRGMHFKQKIILISKFSAYADEERDGILHYLGHNIVNDHGGRFNQTRTGENERFCDAVDNFKKGGQVSYFKIFQKRNKWMYKGEYALIDYNYTGSKNPNDINSDRKVYEFLLRKNRHFE